jgi:hypothetical protein
LLGGLAHIASNGSRTIFSPLPFATLLALFKPEAWGPADAFERALFVTGVE